MVRFIAASILVALLAVIGLVAAACGSDDDSGTESSSTEGATEGTDATTEGTDATTEGTDATTDETEGTEAMFSHLQYFADMDRSADMDRYAIRVHSIGNLELLEDRFC